MLAALAIEELGRWTILLELRQKLMNGKEITLNHINDACAAHATKQAKGMRGITMRVPSDSMLSKLARAKWQSKPGTEERQEINSVGFRMIVMPFG